MSAQSEPVVIVVGGTNPVYRGYCVEGAASEHRLVLIDTAAPAGLVAELVVDHEVADTRDTAAVVAAGLALAARHEVAGVLTWDEYALLPTAVLTERLGLRGNSVAAVRACRDKGTTRRLLAEAGVPSAKSVRVSSREEAETAAAAIGFPVVLKPASHAASIGVVRVDTPEGFASGWEFASAGAGEQGPEGSGVLVEEYLDGPEVSVECVTLAGETVVAAVTRKEIEFAPFFEEVGHTVTADDPLLPVVAPVARQSLRALGVTDGVQHVEMRLTASGPRIIEVNVRIGGDWIGKLVRLATGLDLPAVAASIAADRTPDLMALHRASAAVRIVYPPVSGILTERRLVAGVQEAGWLREPGETVVLPPEGDLSNARIGYLITTGASLDEVLAARADAERSLVVDVRPAERAA